MEFYWDGFVGIGVVFVMVICGWEYFCFEVIEDLMFCSDGGWWLYMFDFGIYYV